MKYRVTIAWLKHPVEIVEVDAINDYQAKSSVIRGRNKGFYDTEKSSAVPLPVKVILEHGSEELASGYCERSKVDKKTDELIGNLAEASGTSFELTRKQVTVYTETV